MPATALAEPTTTLSVTEELEDVEAAIESAEMESYLRRAAARATKGRRDPDLVLADQARLASEAFGTNPETGQPYYTAEDVEGWVWRAREMGAARPQLGGQTLVDLYRRDAIPNAIFRERFEAQRDEPGGLSASMLAFRLGETRIDQRDGRKVGDSTRIERILGIQAQPDRGDRPGSLRVFLDYELAVRLADLLGIPYHDCGV